MAKSYYTGLVRLRARSIAVQGFSQLALFSLISRESSLLTLTSSNPTLYFSLYYSCFEVLGFLFIAFPCLFLNSSQPRRLWSSSTSKFGFFRVSFLFFFPYLYLYLCHKLLNDAICRKPFSGFYLELSQMLGIGLGLK